MLPSVAVQLVLTVSAIKRGPVNPLGGPVHHREASLVSAGIGPPRPGSCLWQLPPGTEGHVRTTYANASCEQLQPAIELAARATVWQKANGVLGLWLLICDGTGHEGLGQEARLAIGRGCAAGWGTTSAGPALQQRRHVPKFADDGLEGWRHRAEAVVLPSSAVTGARSASTATDELIRAVAIEGAAGSVEYPPSSLCSTDWRYGDA